MTTTRRYVEIEHCCDCPNSNWPQIKGEGELFCWAEQRPCWRGYDSIPDWCPLPVVPAAEDLGELHNGDSEGG